MSYMDMNVPYGLRRYIAIFRFWGLGAVDVERGLTNFLS
jgi:hypothetical protein